MPRRWKPLISYSTNVHRGERLSDIRQFLDAVTVPVFRRVFGPSDCGLELRLGIGAARDLEEEASREGFREFLASRRLSLFSVNAFPLLDFHSVRVKERVYRPSWDEPERVRWTNVIATILARFLRVGEEGTVSTLGGTFRRRGHDPGTLRAVAAGYIETIAHLERLEAETGKTVLLAVEPEPETTFETASDVIDFFRSHLLPLARRTWRGRRRSRCEEVLRKYFTVNFDACHFSVLFQDLVGSANELEAAGIRIGKIHATSAISLRRPRRSPSAYACLRGMREPRYFHQFCGRDASRRWVWRGVDLDDLPPELPADLAVDELRTHYHVPLHLSRWKRLGMTREETRQLVLHAARRRLTSQFVVETYTWPILRGEYDLVRGIAREMRWLVDVLSEAMPGEP